TASENSAYRSNQVADSARNWLSFTASTSAEAEASEFDLSDLPPTLRHGTVTAKPSCASLNAYPVWSQQSSETARRERGHARTGPASGRKGLRYRAPASRLRP